MHEKALWVWGEERSREAQSASDATFFLRETHRTVDLANAVAASIVQCSTALVAPPFLVF
jgi:hypothetical protein